MELLSIGILASGRGSNFQSIIDSIESGYMKAKIVLLITDNPNAYAIERARKHGIETLVLVPFGNGDFTDHIFYELFDTNER